MIEFCLMKYLHYRTVDNSVSTMRLFLYVVPSFLLYNLVRSITIYKVGKDMTMVFNPLETSGQHVTVSDVFALCYRYISF